MIDKVKHKNRIQNMTLEDFLKHLENLNVKYKKMKENNMQLFNFLQGAENGRVVIKITVDKAGEPKDRNLVIDAEPIREQYAASGKQVLDMEQSIKEDMELWLDKGW